MQPVQHQRRAVVLLRLETRGQPQRRAPARPSGQRMHQLNGSGQTRHTRPLHTGARRQAGEVSGGLMGRQWKAGGRQVRMGLTSPCGTKGK